MCATDETYFLSKRQQIQLNLNLNIDGLVEAAINQLYNDRKIDDATRKQLIQSHYEPLKQAVNEGYNAKVEYGTPNYEFLKQLQINTAVFAAFKNHSSVKEMTALLKDKDGNLRSREDFKTEALKIDKNYRTTRLETEYDTAVRTARMAANWQKIEKNKKLYPNLKYMLTKAAKPDEKHKQYVGIIRPVDDSFWNAHYPPNRWRCQCSVEQVDDDVTDIPNDLPPVPKDFAFNAGKEGKIFDLENGEDIKNVPPREQPKLIKEATKIVDKNAVLDANYQPLYDSRNTGNIVEAHPLSFNNNDFDVVQKTAKELANIKTSPNIIQILPTLSDKILRDKIMPDAPENKNPDYRFDGILFDLKIPSGNKPGSRTIKNLLNDALAQAGNAVLVIPDNYDVKRFELYKSVGYLFRQERYKNFELYLNYKGEWMNFNQSQWNDFYKKTFNKKASKNGG